LAGRGVQRLLRSLSAVEVLVDERGLTAATGIPAVARISGVYHVRLVAGVGIVVVGIATVLPEHPLPT
jgi:hypothetical protein